MQGFKEAKKTFDRAVDLVPAYRTFLKVKKYQFKTIKTYSDFKDIPICTKENYISKNKISKLVFQQPSPNMLYASSGSSGKPSYWLGNSLHEKVGGDIHEFIFTNVLNLNKSDRILVVNTFAMGVWVAGNYTMQACRYLNNIGYQVVTSSPGIAKDDILSILKNISPQFDRTVIFGYPPFVAQVLAQAKKLKINLSSRNISLLTSGDKISELWREQMNKIINKKNQVFNIYGSADAGVLGFETKFSVAMKQLILGNKKCAQEILGEKYQQAMIFQYNPNYIQFEQIGNELIFTTNTAVPLVRYNIHDEGKVFTYNNFLTLLKKNDIKISNKLLAASKPKFPFIILTGRTDIVSRYYALNIYPENIKKSFSHKNIKKYLSGNFSIYTKTNKKNKDEELFINLESAGDNLPNIEQRKCINKIILEELVKTNIEYRKLLQSLGEKAKPKIFYFKKDDKKLLTPNSRQLVQIGTKKPKIILN